MSEVHSLTKEIKLEIGSGKKPREGYLTCDIRPLPGVDIVGSAEAIPLEDQTVTEVFSRHLVEHFTLKEFLQVLQEWNRVLKVGGTLYIICPNLTFHLKQVLEGSHKSLFEKESGKNARYWGMGSLFGWQQNEFDIHKFGYYFELLADILAEFGFEKIENLTDSPLGMEKAPWHLEVRAVKREKSIAYQDSKFFGLLNVTH